MKVIADLCVVPLGVGTSVRKYVSACQQVLNNAGLSTQLHGYGTNVEGEWDEVFSVVTQCYERMVQDCPRISVGIKVDAREGATGRLEGKVAKIAPLPDAQSVWLNPDLKLYSTKIHL